MRAPVDTGGGVRMVAITGGRVSGAMVGAILPGGADWQRVTGDVIEIDARYLLALEDGARVELLCRGRRRADASGFWSSIWLTTGDPRHAALNDAQYIGYGRKVEGHVAIDSYLLPDQPA